MKSPATTWCWLGSAQQRNASPGGCTNLWHFDTECIEDRGSYARIAKRLTEMTQGSLTLDRIADDVDIEAGKARLSFEFRRRPVRIDCKVQDDWVDPAVFRHFVALLGEADPEKVFLYYDLGGQDCILGCVTRAELGKLQQLSPKFQPLR